MVRRWCYPTVPDNAIAGDRMVPYSRGDVYVHPSVSLDYTTSVERRSLIQYGCDLAKETVVSETLLGVNCHIGLGCVLRGCVISDNVTIGEHSILTDCVIMDGTIIQDHCTLDKCTLGMNVIVAPHVTLSGLRIHKYNSLDCHDH